MALIIFVFVAFLALVIASLATPLGIKPQKSIPWGLSITAVLIASSVFVQSRTPQTALPARAQARPTVRPTTAAQAQEVAVKKASDHAREAHEHARLQYAAKTAEDQKTSVADAEGAEMQQALSGVVTASANLSEEGWMTLIVDADNWKPLSEQDQKLYLQNACTKWRSAYDKHHQGTALLHVQLKDLTYTEIGGTNCY